MGHRAVFTKGGLGDMNRRGIGIWCILSWLFFLPLFSFAGEIYRWTDEKGAVHFTDDLSQIPARYQNQFEKKEIKEEVSETGEEQTVPENPSAKPQAKPDRAKEHLEAYERKIEAKKAVEKRIATLEEEMRAVEERMKQLKEAVEFQRHVPQYRYYPGFRVRLEDPPSERERLQVRIQNIKKEIAALEEQRSKIIRGL